jgi:hypothetical protein
MSDITKRLIAAGFGLYLFLPLFGRILGVEPHQIENRPLAPKPSFSAERLLDTDFYKSVTAYLVDTHPWRSVAVASAAWLNLEIFNDSPSPRVHVGRKNWLFFDDALRMPCGNQVPLKEILANLNHLATMIEESGRQFSFLITPNKSALYPEFMNAKVRSLESCSADKRAELRSLLGTAGPRGYVDMFDQLQKAKAETSDPLYFSNDSHLNSLGSFLQTGAIISYLRPDLWRGTSTLPPKKRPHIGDLTRLMGLPSAVPTDRYSLKRQGIRLVEEIKTELGGEPPLRRYRSAGQGLDLVTAPTLFLHDSQLNISIPMLRQYFADVSFVHWNTFDPEAIAPLVADSSLVVLQVVERGFYNRMSYQIGARGFLDNLEHLLSETVVETVSE